MLTALAAVDNWPTQPVAVGVIDADGCVHTNGPGDWVTRLASVTKILFTYAVLVALEEGTVRLDDPIGQPGATVRHLLAHAGGYGFDGDDPVAKPGTRRIYSNTGFELLGQFLAARSGMALDEYLHDAVFEPLSMTSTQLRGSPAHQAFGNVDDLLRFALELREPTLVDRSTLAAATSVQFPGLRGVLPGFGAQNPMDWGLGFELHDAKSPHWMGQSTSPEGFGHFGGSGTYFFVDPVAQVAVACLTDHEFGPWAVSAWPALNDAILDELSA
jgi:CubicO group peptidase (beta-lactamase class C family)